MRQRGTVAGIDAMGVGVCVAIAGAVYMLGVVPSRDSAAAAARDRTELCARQKDIADFEAWIQDDKRQLEELAGSAATDQVQARTSLDRISRLSDIAATSGVTVTEVTPKPVVTGTKYNQNPLVLTGSGRTSGFMALLSALHKEFPDTQVVSLTIQGNPEQREAPQAMSAELVWYTLAGGVGGGAGGGASGGGAGRAGAAGAKDAPKPEKP